MSNHDRTFFEGAIFIVSIVATGLVAQDLTTRPGIIVGLVMLGFVGRWINIARKTDTKEK